MLQFTSQLQTRAVRAGYRDTFSITSVVPSIEFRMRGSCPSTPGLSPHIRGVQPRSMRELFARCWNLTVKPTPSALTGAVVTKWCHCASVPYDACADQR
jgi:hypothetical protein